MLGLQMNKIVKKENDSFKKKTIVQVLGGSPKKIGSLEEYFLALTAELSKEGFKTVFIFDKEISNHIKSFYDNEEAEIINMPITNKHLDLPLILKYRKLLKRINPLLINVHFGYTGINVLIASYLAGIKNTIWTKRSLNENGPFYQRVSL